MNIEKYHITLKQDVCSFCAEENNWSEEIHATLKEKGVPRILERELFFKYIWEQILKENKDK